MFTFMLGTGCRISETVGLCWGDIDFESGFITIQHNLVYHDHEVGGCYFTMSTPKTAAGKRAIPILPEVRKALEQERANQQELELVCEYEIDGISDFVFLNRFGQPQNPQTVNRAIKRISVAYNEAELERAEKQKRELNCTPFVRQYSILFRKWGVFVCQKRKNKRHIPENSKSKPLKQCEMKI